jgi:hypothetical protein
MATARDEARVALVCFADVVQLDLVGCEHALFFGMCGLTGEVARMGC